MTFSIFGRVVTRWDVERAVADTIDVWLPEYLAAVQAQHPSLPFTIPSPVAGTVTGGVDDETWQPSTNPGVLVNAVPTGDAELVHGDAGEEYAQWFEVTLHTVGQGGDEDHARMLVDTYAAAVMAAVAQHGDLGQFANDTRLVEFPRTSFPDPAERTFMESTSVFHVLVSPVVQPALGPVTPTQATGPWPTVASAHATFTAYPASAAVPQPPPAGWAAGTPVYPEPAQDGP